jgi:hypothetical protein
MRGTDMATLAYTLTVLAVAGLYGHHKLGRLRRSLRRGGKT